MAPPVRSVFVTCPRRVRDQTDDLAYWWKLLARPFRSQYLLRLGVRARRVSVSPELIVLNGRIDGSAFHIKLTILQGLVFREICFFFLLEKEFVWIGT